MCRRQVIWHGQVEVIEVAEHSFAWTGRMPCTGERRCVYCGELEPGAIGCRAAMLRGGVR